MIRNFDQSEVWDGFRVADRARIIDLYETKNIIKASHDGYLKYGFIHSREFKWKLNEIIIEDKINKTTSNNSKAFYHLHNSIGKPIIDGSIITFDKIEMKFCLRIITKLKLKSIICQKDIIKKF